METNNNHLKWFTLVELIIVITILAILSTIAFISFQNYTKSARDSVRLASIKNVMWWLEITNIKTWKYPQPDNWQTLNWNTWSYIIQWEIWNNVKTLIWLQNDLKDPLDWKLYVYSIFKDWKYYQIWTNREETQTSYIKNTYASNLWVMLDWNYQFDPSLPSLITITWSVNTNSWIFDPNVCFIINNWKNTLSSTNTNCKKKSEMSLKNYDENLMWYWDMETTSWWLLKDLSWNWNNGNPSWNISIWWISWFQSKWTYFDWISSNISILNQFYWTWFNWFWYWTWETVSYTFQIDKNTTIDTTNMVVMTRNWEMTSCVWTWYLIFRDNRWNWITQSKNFKIELWEYYNVTATYWLTDWIVKLYLNWKLLDERLEWVFQPSLVDGIFNIWFPAWWCSWVKFNWILDEIKIYNKVLSSFDIMQQAKISWF